MREYVRSFLLLLMITWAAGAFAASKPNIVLITLDSVRADRVGFMAGAGKGTPNLDSLARKSMVFEQAYAQAPLTVVSHATILSGTYPQTHKVTQFGVSLPASLPYLADILHGQGYQTEAFVGSIELDPKNGLAPGFARGFDVYDAGFHQPAKGVLSTQSVQRRGALVAGRAIQSLATAKSPFFLWVNLHDAAVSNASANRLGVTACDAAVGKLVAALMARKMFDDALFVVASDHGESLGAHGEQSHGVFLYDETVHVPVLVKMPKNQDAGKRVKNKVGLVDVAPTMLEVAGVPVPAQMQGQSLMRVAKSGSDQPVYSRTQFPMRAFGWSTVESWRAGKYLYIHAPHPELYDTAADPGATKNLAQASKAIADTMASQLSAFNRRFSEQAAGNAAGLSSSEAQKLASLGYVGLQKSAGPASVATGTDPKDEIATANKVLAAIALMEDGKPEKAVEAAEPFAGASSKMYLPQFAMGVALAQQDQCVKAVGYLHTAIELMADSPWAHYYIGSCLVKTGDYKTAAVHLEIATTRLPDFKDGHERLAYAYEHLGRLDDAKKERSKAEVKGKI